MQGKNWSARERVRPYERKKKKKTTTDNEGDGEDTIRVIEYSLDVVAVWREPALPRMEIRCSRKRCAGSVAGCFLDGSRVASGWAGGVAGGQKWVVRVGWELAACGWWEWGEGTQYHPPRPFNPAVLGGAVEPVPSPPSLPSSHPLRHSLSFCLSHSAHIQHRQRNV